jgi:hypothetical protein
VEALKLLGHESLDPPVYLIEQYIQLFPDPLLGKRCGCCRFGRGTRGYREVKAYPIRGPDQVGVTEMREGIS